MESKFCRKCKQLRLVSFFHKNQYRKDGYHDQCKTCRLEETTKRYIKHKDSIDERNRRYAREHPIRRRAIVQRYRCKIEGATGDVSFTDWRDVLVRQRFLCRKCRTKKPLEMDHIIPLSRGGQHIKENVQGLCVPCHRQKDSVLYRKSDYYEKIY